MIHLLTPEEIEKVNKPSNEFWVGVAELMGAVFLNAHPLLNPEIQEFVARKSAQQLQLTPDKIELFVHGFIIGYSKN